MRIEDMTPEDLGKYVVTLPGWRYVPGMVYDEDDVIIDGGDDYFCIPQIGGQQMFTGLWPVNVLKPGTIGGLVATARRLYNRPGLHTRCIQRPMFPADGQEAYTEWCVRDEVLNLYGGSYMPTEAHALVAAIAKAPFHMEANL